MSDGLIIDFSQITALGNRAAAAPAMIREEMSTGGREAGFIVTAQAIVNAPVDTGNLRAGIGPPQVHALNDGVTVLIPSHAEYSLAVEKGRRGFGPTSAKVLHFFVGGKEVFTKRVGPARAQPFLAPALRQTEAKTRAVFAKAMDRAVSRILGGR